MSFSDSQVRAFKATDKRQKASCGDSLFLVMEPISKGGGKSFMGRIRFPPGRTSSVVDVRIGVYGKGTGKWSLKEARDEWELIRHGVGRTTRTQETGRGSRKVLVHERESPTLQQVWESFLFDWTGANAQGKKDYQNLLWNQVMPHFGAKTPVD